MAKLTSNTIRELFGAVVKSVGGSMSQKITQRFNPSKESVTVSDLFDAWEEANSPNDSKEIINLLNNQGISRKHVEKAFQIIGLVDGQEEDESITDFANAIKKAGLNDQVLQYLNGMNESILTEKPISNKSIKDLFIKIIDKLETVGRDDEMESARPDLGRKRIL